MFVMQLRQPQPGFSNHSLTAVGRVVDVKTIQFDTHKFNVCPKTYKNLYTAIHKE